MVLIHQTVQPSNLISKCLFSHFNTKLLISSSLSQLWDQSDWRLQITGSYFKEPSLHLVTMWSFYRPEPVLKSSNPSWCFAVQSLYEHVGALTSYMYLSMCHLLCPNLFRTDSIFTCLSCNISKVDEIFRRQWDAGFEQLWSLTAVNPSLKWAVKISLFLQ